MVTMNIEKKILFEKLLHLMLNNKRIKLSQDGKKNIDACWENSSKEKWFIGAINSSERIDLYSENHLSINDVSLDWLIIK